MNTSQKKMITFRIKQASHYTLPIGIIVIGILLSVSIFIIVLDWEHQRIQTEFNQDAEERFEALKREIESDLHVLDSITAFYTHGHKIGRSEFRDFVKHFLLRHRSIQALEWIPRIPNNQREAYEKAAKQDGYLNFRITDRKAQGKMVRAPQRNEYFPVYLVEPYEGNEIALGFDLGSDPTRLKSLARSRDTGEMVASARIKLVQETTDQFGFLVFEPIYRKDGLMDSVESRREKLEGFVLGVFRIADIVEKSVSYLTTKGINFYLYDESAPMQDRFLYFHQSRPSKDITMSKRSEKAETERSFQYTKTLDVAGWKWKVLYTPLPEYITARRTWQPLGLLLIGLLFTASYGSYLLINIKRTERIEKLVKERTDELSIANKELRHEITERKEVEEALRSSEERYRLILESIQDGYFEVDLAGNCTFANDARCRSLGYTREELIGVNNRQFEDKENAKKVYQAFNRVYRTGEPINRLDEEVIRKDGTRAFSELSVSLIRDPEEKPIGFRGISRDVTERKRIEEALRQSNQFNTEVISNAAEGIIVYDREFRYEVWNRFMEDLTGMQATDVLGKCAFDLFPHLPEQGIDRLLERALHGETVSSPDTPYHIPQTGKRGWVSGTYGPHRDARGSIIGVIGIVRDITERKRVEEVLRESEEKYRSLIANAMDAIFIAQDGLIKFPNPTALAMTGYSQEELTTLPFLTFIHPDDRDMVLDNHRRRLEGEEVPNTYPFRIINKKGEELWGQLNATLITWDGKPAVLCFIRDITERKQAEEALRSSEEQLRQSQKMEAIGRLAGGIAHDFNNLLTVIGGNCQLSLLELKERDPMKETIEEIKRAGEKAADLTRQLLAFSRRQILEMKVLDLNTVVRDLDKMLHRLIGEDIELTVLLADDLRRVKTDPGWIEQIIMNLAVNARDAMPSGGKLSIETANVELDEAYVSGHIAAKPGRYVMLSMSDTGVGMTPEVRQLVFEPFFTTKEKGKGTGLGLSTVYGIVKQSGGNISVYSEPGLGTTFKIYLPSVDESLEEMREKVPREEFPRGGETILVVEDEEDVRKLAVRVLERQGYRVLEASCGDDALTLGKEPIHMILTDVVMPGLSGRELAGRLTRLYPKMKVLYMSGYTDNAIVHHGVLEEGMNYIQKPFTIDKLMRKVRAILDKDLKHVI
jgi:PAS domain S-box-containing protein